MTTLDTRSPGMSSGHRSSSPQRTTTSSAAASSGGPNSNAAPSTSSVRSSGISVRIWKVTDSTASFEDDDEAKEALRIVSERYASAPTLASTTHKAARKAKGKGRAYEKSSAAPPALPARAAARNGHVSTSGDGDSGSGSSSDIFSETDDDEEDDDHSPWLPTRRSSLSGSQQSSRRSLLHHGRIDISAATRARTDLKRDIEGKLVDTSLKFLDAFGKVDERLQVLRSHLQEMQMTCTDIQTQLDSTDQRTRSLLERADGLREQKASTQLRSRLAQMFLSRFTLTPGEAALLSAREIEVDAALFAAMDKVIRIRRDCQSLFAFVGEVSSISSSGGGGDHHVEGSTEAALAGKEIMAATADQLEAAYDKIHRWCEFEFRKYTRDASLEVSPVMQEAVKRLLSDRDRLLESALQVLSSTRQSAVSQAFLDALIKGGPGGMPRPIELHAHDPTRYVGDMLAWIHQATAGEREFLDALLDIRVHAKHMVGSTRDAGGDSPAEVLGRESLDKHLEGLGRPLKARVKQVVQSQEDIIVSYKIANLVQFYLVTMQRTIGQQAVLTQNLRDLYNSALSAFESALQARGRSLLRFLHPPDANLSAPPALRDAAATLQEVMSVYDTSLTDDQDRENDFARILDDALEPVMEMCKSMANLLPRAGDWDKHTFMLNCGLYLIQVLSPFTFTVQRKIALQEQVDDWVASLTDQHYERLLEQSGMLPLLTTNKTRTSDTPLSSLPNADAKALSRFARTFDDFLTSLDVSTSPRLALISSPKLATSIHRNALEIMARAYASLHKAVHDKENKYEFPSTVLGRAPAEVTTLLGVDNVD